MIDLSVSREEVGESIGKYFPSLRRYPDKYQWLFTFDSKIIEPHCAYICPLCLINVILIDPVHGFRTTSDFTMDHYPPKSVGKDFLFTVMVCKDCNNKAGSEYDFALKKKLQEVAFKKKVPGSKIQGIETLSNITGRYPGEFIIGEDGQLEVSLKPNQKSHSPYLDDFMANQLNSSQWQIDMTIKNADEDLVERALVKIAYLICFEKWGYEFIFSSNGEKMRQVLAGNLKYPLKTAGLWLDDQIHFDKSIKFPLGLCYIANPPSCKGFVVNILLVDKNTNMKTAVSVLVPNPTEKGWSDMQKIESIISDAGSIQLIIDHVKDTFISQGVYDGYTQSWDKINSKD